MILFFSPPGVNRWLSQAVIRSMSGAREACLTLCLISLCWLPGGLWGTFPDVRCDAATLHESEFCCAAFKAGEGCVHLEGWAACCWSITVLVILSMNLCIEQLLTLHGGVYQHWRSATWLSLNLELRCFAMIGSLFTFVSREFILDDVLNLPSCIFLIVSATGLESARMRIACLDSALITVATLSPSILQGWHLVHWSFSLD